MKDLICEIEDCNKPKRRKKAPYCSMHYGRLGRHGDPLISKLNNTHRGHVGCSIKCCKNEHYSKGLCHLHYGHKYQKDTPNYKESLKKAQKKYNKTPKGLAASALKVHRRRAKDKSDVKLKAQDVINIRESFNHQCFNCGQTKDLQLDHHIPQWCGGKLEVGNVVILCIICNGTKSGQLPENFYNKDQLETLKNKHHIFHNKYCTITKN